MIDLLSFILGTIVGFFLGFLTIFIYLRITMKKMLGNLSDVEKLLEMFKK